MQGEQQDRIERQQQPTGMSTTQNISCMNISHHDFEHLGLPQHPAALQALAHGLVHGQCEAQSNPAARQKAFNAGSIHHGALAVCLIHNQTLLFQDASTIKAACLRAVANRLCCCKQDLRTCGRTVNTQCVHRVPSHPTWAQMLDTSHSNSVHANPMSALS